MDDTWYCVINNEDFDAPAHGLSAREMGVFACETV